MFFATHTHTQSRLKTGSYGETSFYSIMLFFLFYFSTKIYFLSSLTSSEIQPESSGSTLQFPQFRNLLRMFHESASSKKKKGALNNWSYKKKKKGPSCHCIHPSLPPIISLFFLSPVLLSRHPPPLYF